MNFQETLQQPESRKLEFKRTLPANLNELLKTLVAFANGAGGELIIGVSDKERIIFGVDDPLLLEERIASSVYDGISPPISPYISTLHIQEKEILIVQVLPGSHKPYFLRSFGPEKGVYVRIGSTNRRATPEMFEELRWQGVGAAFETKMDMKHQADAFDQASLSAFFTEIGQPDPTPETLAKWSLLKRNNDDVFPTVAGLVLFGSSDLPDYDYAGIRLTKFQGNTMTNISETREYVPPILSQVETICRHTADFLQKESYLDGIRRLERTIIPFYAIREVIVNAIVHRDYSINGSTIKIHVFDDRLEVISPGILYGNLDLADLGTGLSNCRNRAIVRIFRKLSLMEELGTGIARINHLFQEQHLPTPQFFEQGQFFKAILPQQRFARDT